MQNNELLEKIRTAFNGVTLGGGIGLHQANAIDDYKSNEECLRERERDEKLNWQIVSAGDLNHCFSSYSYLDAEGVRFYLPAMMVCEVSGAYNHSVGDRLSSGHAEERYEILNREQRVAVIEFLNWCVSGDDYDFERMEIVEALLNGHWRDEQPPNAKPA